MVQSKKKKTKPLTTHYIIYAKFVRNWNNRRKKFLFVLCIFVTGASGTVIATLSRGDADSQASASRLASLHVKAAKELACRRPQPKIIRISDHYPSADKMYFPSCTRLHQCAQDTGCCVPSKKCGPKSTQRVELYFYVSLSVLFFK